MMTYLTVYCMHAGESLLQQHVLVHYQHYVVYYHAQLCRCMRWLASYYPVIQVSDNINMLAYQGQSGSIGLSML
jgi:hypothetical protein